MDLNKPMSIYTFQDLPIGGLFVSADHILKEKSSLEFILEKISENKAIYRDDKGKIQRTVSIQPDESIIRLCYLSSYPHHGRRELWSNLVYGIRRRSFPARYHLQILPLQ